LNGKLSFATLAINISNFTEEPICYVFAGSTLMTELERGTEQEAWFSFV
jgi:hypothetical protein